MPTNVACTSESGFLPDVTSNTVIPRDRKGGSIAIKQSMFIICARAADRKGKFVAEPGPTRYLRVPLDAQSYDTSHEIKSREKWRLAVRAAADGTEDEITGITGDILVFVHGYNNGLGAITWRTRTL